MMKKSTTKSGTENKQRHTFEICQRGFTLVEIMVSIVILGIGLLGLTGLQMSGIKNTRTATHTRQSTLLAYDMVERMQSNAYAVKQGSYNNVSSVEHTCDPTAPCSSDQQAEMDMYQWTAELAKQLPLGTGHVCIDSTPTRDDTPGNPDCDGAGDVYVIKVWWDRDGSGAISNNTSDPDENRDIPLIIGFQP